MKHFITADIEAPHRSYYAFIDPPREHFLYKWAWAEEDGGPPEGALFFDDLARAEEVVASLKESGGGLGQHSDSIEVTSLEVD